jgi:hypothetical protein
VFITSLKIIRMEIRVVVHAAAMIREMNMIEIKLHNKSIVKNVQNLIKNNNVVTRIIMMHIKKFELML